ncbi:hypothetical protein ACCD10_09105 [Pseudomonas sp. Pseusp122]|uniref:hypothetical protein n=1 Tax=unclassified Pseudomonas TaxID=196821 RepID=UPI0039A660C6
MNFYRSKNLWVAIIMFSPLLLVAAHYGLKIMTSVYKRDFGNGVVVYADDFVKSGKWVFDCSNSRLISRQPLVVPLAELEESGRLTIGRMYSLSDADEAQATVAIRAITGIDGWYKKLYYRYSYVGEDNDLNLHVFDLLARHDGRLWALNVEQWLDSKNGSSFEIIAEPYDPETYMDYAKSLQAAAKSCPVPQ